MARRRIDPDQELDPDELEEKLEEEGAFDSRGLLKDGHATRVKMYMRDGSPNPYLTATQQAIAASRQHKRPLVNDGAGDPMAMHKPGFRYLTDNKQRAISDAVKAEAYDEYEEEANNAWKGVTNTTDALRGQQQGDVCDRRQDAAAHDSKAAAYEQYDREMANAWRIGK